MLYDADENAHHPAVLVALRAFGQRGETADSASVGFPFGMRVGASGHGISSSSTPAAPPVAPPVVHRKVTTFDRSAGMGSSSSSSRRVGQHELGLGHPVPVPSAWPCSSEAIRCVVEEWTYY